MKLFRSPNPSISLQNLRSNFKISALSARSSSSSSSETLVQDSLYQRVRDFEDRSASIVPILEKWVEEGKSVEKNSLLGIVKQLRRMNRFSHALEVSKWMSDRRYFPLSVGDLAVRINLIYNVHGIEHAENYFNNLPKPKRLHQTYGALLNCYAEEKSIEKAESLFEKMKKLDRVTSFPYNMLISLYSCTGQEDKMDILLQEMKEKGIPCDNFTDNILIDAYANLLNINKMEEVLQRVEQAKALDYFRCAIVARAYLKAGLKEKALEKIKLAEKMIPSKTSRAAWGFLITLYAEIGKKGEMYRIWNANKSSFEKASNSVYMCMISALLKLDDLDGAEALFSEWKSQFNKYDIRIPKVLINAYCKKGLLSKAEPLVSEAVSSGQMLSSNTWADLADAYFKVGQISKAVEMMKKIEQGKSWWKPSSENVSTGLKYFEEKRDVEGAEEFVELVKKLNPLTREVYHGLISVYLIAERPVSKVFDRMKADGFDEDEETDDILDGN